MFFFNIFCILNMIKYKKSKVIDMHTVYTNFILIIMISSIINVYPWTNFGNFILFFFMINIVSLRKQSNISKKKKAWTKENIYKFFCQGGRWRWVVVVVISDTLL